jgi:hypothetical protein
MAAEGFGDPGMAGRATTSKDRCMNSDASLRGGKLILRVAAIVAMLQAAAHLALFLRSEPRPGSAAWPLVEAMRVQVAPGHTTYWGMYFGYGLLAALMAFFIAALTWLASTFDAGSRRIAEPLVGMIFAAVAIHAILSARYFFVLPLLFDTVVAALLAAGWVAIRTSE